MILDAQLEFSDAQAVTSTAISTNVIDLGPVADNTTRDLGLGEGLWLVVLCVVAGVDADGSPTVTISLESDSTADLATSATVHYTTGAIAEASCTAGAVLAAVRLPSGSYEQYLGIRYTVASGAFDTGNFDAFLVKDYASFSTYASRSTITAEE